MTTPTTEITQTQLIQKIIGESIIMSKDQVVEFARQSNLAESWEQCEALTGHIDNLLIWVTSRKVIDKFFYNWENTDRHYYANYDYPWMAETIKRLLGPMGAFDSPIYEEKCQPIMAFQIDDMMRIYMFVHCINRNLRPLYRQKT